MPPVGLEIRAPVFRVKQIGDLFFTGSNIIGVKSGSQSDINKVAPIPPGTTDTHIDRGTADSRPIKCIFVKTRHILVSSWLKGSALRGHRHGAQKRERHRCSQQLLSFSFLHLRFPFCTLLFPFSVLEIHFKIYVSYYYTTIWKSNH